MRLPLVRRVVGIVSCAFAAAALVATPGTANAGTPQTFFNDGTASSTSLLSIAMLGG